MRYEVEGSPSLVPASWSSSLVTILENNAAFIRARYDGSTTSGFLRLKFALADKSLAVPTAAGQDRCAIPIANRPEFMVDSSWVRLESRALEMMQVCIGELPAYSGRCAGWSAKPPGCRAK